jgi:hypothetical protein
MMYRYVSIFISVSILYLYGGCDIIQKPDVYLFIYLFMYYGVIIRYVSD